MKKDFGHIVTFALLTIMIVSGAVFALGQLRTDIDNGVFTSNDSVFPVTFVDGKSSLDTLRFLTNPSYDYCEYNRSENGDQYCDELSQTVVRVNPKSVDCKKISDSKKFAANASLNLMYETYKVKREKDSCSTTFIVTIESFDTYLESLSDEEIRDYSTSFPTEEDFTHALRSEESFDLIRKYCDESRPL